MKTALISFLNLVIGFSLWASEPDYRSYFSHPDAQICIRIGDAHSEAIPHKNHTIPKIAGEIPGFQNGFGTSGGRSDNPNVHWQFIQKTEFGDLYLIDVEKQDALIKAIPVLYTGLPLVAYEHGDIQVIIQPIHSDAK